MILKAQDISLTFKSSRRLFHGLSLELKKAEVLGLLGPSGCGKSTLLRILMGLQKPDEGDVEGPLVDFSAVFQDHNLLPWRDVAENIRLPLELQSARIIEDELAVLLHKVHLDKKYLHHSVHELSGGMKMRAAMARSLVKNPRCLFLDEPFSALDEHTRFGLQDLLMELLETQKLSAVFVTHSIAEAVYLADRILILDQNGRIADEFIRPPDISRGKDLRTQVAFFETVQKVNRLYEQAQGRGKT